MGQLDEAEVLFKQVVSEEPDNRAANYYLNLIKDRHFRRTLDSKELVTRQALVDIEKDWLYRPSPDPPIQPGTLAQISIGAAAGNK